MPTERHNKASQSTPPQSRCQGRRLPHETPPDDPRIDNLNRAIAALKTRLPAERLILDTTSRRAYECDGLTAYRETPGVVVLPRSLDEIRDVLAIARETATPIVPRGAGTGLSGGATPRADAILLSLARFNRILDIDPEQQIAVVEPGVRNLAVSEAAAAFGLYYAPDPSSQIACTIGGNVAENAGGVHCLKYGLTTHNVLGLRMLTIDGDEIELGGPRYDDDGLNLLGAVIGSEGLLGIVTQVTLRLLPKPERVQVLLADFDDVATATQAVAGIFSTGIVPAGLEMMDNAAIRAAEDFVHAGYPIDAAALLLVEVDGSNAAVSEDVMRLRTRLLELGARHIRTAADAAERNILWAGRKAAFPAAGRISPDYYCMDGTIPRRALANLFDQMQRLSEYYGLRVCNVFHAGDGNLHPLILFDASRPQETERAEAFGLDILNACVDAGGTITGEHGVGLEKLDGMCHQFSALELQTFFALRQAFDPKALLNPGKAIPTLTRCAETRRDHRASLVQKTFEAAAARCKDQPDTAGPPQEHALSEPDRWRTDLPRF